MITFKEFVSKKSDYTSEIQKMKEALEEGMKSNGLRQVIYDFFKYKLGPSISNNKPDLVRDLMGMNLSDTEKEKIIDNDTLGLGSISKEGDLKRKQDKRRISSIDGNPVMVS